MRMKLTDAMLRKYRPKTARDEVFDKDVPGFGVRITQGGKAFFFVRRVRGEKVRFSLGHYPAVSLAKARSEALAIVDKIRLGEDPRPKRKVESELDTYGHVVQRFLDEYVTGRKTPLRAATLRGYRQSLQDYTAPWASRPIGDITDKDVIRLIDKLEAQKHFATARLAKARLRSFFNWCVAKRLLDKNPAQNAPLASTPADFKRERVLTIPELQAILEASDGLGEAWRNYLWMLILTGQRRTETALTKWADLALEGDKPIWKIPAAHTKNRQAHEVPIAAEAVEVLSRVPKIGEHVFSVTGGSYSRLKLMLDKALAEAGQRLMPWTIHDLRRSVATGIAELGFAPHVIEMVLNHVSGEKAGVSGLYNRSRYEADCRRALCAWAKAVTAKDMGNVVALRA